MEIRYLCNSAFACVMEKSLIVFDYYKNAPEGGEKSMKGGVIGKEDLALREKAYAFASHIHGDHFNPVIFDWQDCNKNTSYFLDSAIARGIHMKPPANVYAMKKGDEKTDGYVTARAYGSTDTGISYYVRAEGIDIFHAGDLNLWHWRAESTEAEVREATEAFYREMADIEKTMPRPDIAFFPVDAVMGEGYDEGARYFIKAMKPKVFIPMHCRTGLSHLPDFKRRAENADTRILIYTRRGEKIL
jgi:L-ascorbate metabolism protein UlaG (beta-lactamase superfamily)